MKNKMLFALPNLFTITSIVFGVYAMIRVAGAAGPNDFIWAVVALAFSVMCDMMDGRVARLTRTASEFGVQLDSLADLVAFGVAPAIVFYNWALKDLGIAGIAAAAMFVVCGALRLARFNVMAGKHKGVLRHFTGLPIPAAASFICSVVLLEAYSNGAPALSSGQMLVLVVITSYLMISNIRFRTFKDARPSPASFSLFVLIAFCSTYVGTTFSVPVMLFGMATTYVVLGLVEEVVFFRARRRAEVDDSDEQIA